MSSTPNESRQEVFDRPAFPADRPDEAPEADAVEQSLPVAADEPDDEDDFEVPIEVDPADAVDQRRKVGDQDEEDYR
jgi:hypothetical protein